jgi:multicomponent Na+:H+ antiporter subunit B
MRLDVLLRIGAKLVLPFILLFALYVQFHGEYGPGGGFQAGVIVAAAVILYAIVFGIAAAQRVVPLRWLERLIPAGVLVYLSAGLPALFAGRNYLDYGALAAESAAGHARGIMWIESGVLITVTATMIAIFYAFAGRGRS